MAKYVSSPLHCEVLREKPTPDFFIISSMQVLWFSDREFII